MAQINLNNFKVITDKLNTFFVNNKFMVGSGIPTEGEFNIGDIIINDRSITTEDPMWICTEAGTPGTWEVFNSGSGGSDLICLKNNVVVNEAVSEVEVGIEGFDNETDLLTVYRNSIYMIEGIDYEVNGSKIVSLDGQWNADGGSDYKFTFEVMKMVDKVNPEAVVGMENLKDDVKEAIEAASNIDLSGYQAKTDDGLSTTDKSIVGAINELFQSANNGKELIASAIGEPLSAEDTFQAMSTDINGLLSTFKTNMMNNGVSVESGDKFKELIEKIQGLTEGEGNKGIQYAEGVAPYSSTGGTTRRYTVYEVDNLPFVPTYVFCYIDGAVISYDSNHTTNLSISSIPAHSYYDNGNVSTTLTINNNSFSLTIDTTYLVGNGDVNWYAIGVGEEDTTLRDSLASILEEEGVTVTEEDDMASLITKVDEEFAEKTIEINELEQQANKFPNWFKMNGEWIYGAEITDYFGDYGTATVDNIIHCINDSQHLCYDISDNTYSTKTVLPTARGTYTLTEVVDGKIYCIGGVGKDQTNECYDPTTDTWTSKSKCPTDIYLMAGGVIDNKIYQSGGNTGANYAQISYCFCYDPASDTWSSKANMPANRAGSGSGVANNLLYQFGGVSYGWADTTNSIYCYDPTTNTWSTKSNMKYSPRFTYVASVNNKLYYMGGCNSSGGTYYNYNYQYDPVADTSTAMTNIPSVLGEMGYKLPSVGKYICIIGGSRNNVLNSSYGLLTNMIYITPEQ